MSELSLQRKKKRQIIAVTIMVFALLGSYVASPYLAVNGLKSALQSGDAKMLEKYIDFPVLRQNIKYQLYFSMSQYSRDTSQNAITSGLSDLIVSTLIDNMITPAGLANLLRFGNAIGTNPSKDTALSSDWRVGQGFISLNRFEVRIRRNDNQETTALFYRHGLSWKLSEVDIPRMPLNSASENPFPMTSPFETNPSLVPTPAAQLSPFPATIPFQISEPAPVPENNQPDCELLEGWEFVKGYYHSTYRPHSTSLKNSWNDIQRSISNPAPKLWVPGYITGYVRSNSDKPIGSIQIEYNLYDQDGNQVGSVTDNVMNLEPYGNWNFKITLEEDNVSEAECVGLYASY